MIWAEKRAVFYNKSKNILTNIGLYCYNEIFYDKNETNNQNSKES